MKDIFKTFCTSACYSDLDNKIKKFAESNGYVEIARSAPAMCMDKDQVLVIAVTSTFKPVKKFEVDENFFDTLK